MHLIIIDIKKKREEYIFKEKEEQKWKYLTIISNIVTYSSTIFMMLMCRNTFFDSGMPQREQQGQKASNICNQQDI